jgi:hypothetical protein
MDLELKRQLKRFGILDKIHFERKALLPYQVREYGIPGADEGGGYDIDALNAYNLDLFKRLLTDNVDDCFGEGIHDKVMKEVLPKKNIEKIVSDRVGFSDKGEDEE